MTIREENPFEDPQSAEEWIKAVENDDGNSRDRELYPLLSEWFKELSPKLVVEIGSGQGVVSSKVDLGQSKYIGIEPSERLVDRAKELYSAPNKKFIIGTAYDTTLSDNVADAVFSLGVWFHIKDLDKAHQEISRILKPNGQFCILNANPNMYSLWESWFENTKKEGKVLEGSFKMPRITLSKNIFYLHTEEEILHSLESNNFEVLSVKKLGYGKEGQEHHRDEGAWMAIKAINKK